MPGTTAERRADAGRTLMLMEMLAGKGLPALGQTSGAARQLASSAARLASPLQRSLARPGLHRAVV